MNKKKLIFTTFLRHALFEEIISTPTPELNNPSLITEFEFIRTMAQLQLLIQKNQKVNLNMLESLFYSAIQKNEITPLIKIRIATTLIVMTCRFGYKRKIKILRMAQQIILSLIHQNNATYEEILCFSYAYRGMAMLPFLEESAVDQYLMNAKVFGETVVSNVSSLKLVAKENMYTYFQTFSKWNITKKHIKKAFEAIENMIHLDPYDAVGYAEMGFLCLKIADYKNAEKNFEKASMLGPPSIGMHLFYQAYCLIQLKKLPEAELALIKAINIDSTAISPYHALFHFYRKQRCFSKQINIALKIYKNKNLFNQLNNREKKQIINIMESK